MMNTEEFTFPIITTNDVVHLNTVLPPLWRISSINSDSGADPDHQSGRRRRKIFSEITDNGARDEELTVVGKSEEAEEKMDILWEDFNEELSIQSSSAAASISEDDHNYNGEEEFETAQEFDDFIPTSTKKKNLELVVKMLKKVFLIQNMAHFKKTGLHS